MVILSAQLGVKIYENFQKRSASEKSLLEVININVQRAGQGYDKMLTDVRENSFIEFDFKPRTMQMKKIVQFNLIKEQHEDFL